jgi:ATP-dependent Clp protease ATP-binding subunit ClpA
VLSSELEYCLNEAYQKARDARHEYMTVEHLLLSILDAPRVREILKACGADLARLQVELQKFIDETTPALAAEDDREVQPTLGFQRVLQRAVFNVRRAARRKSRSRTCWSRSSARSSRTRHTCCRCRIDAPRHRQLHLPWPPVIRRRTRKRARGGRRERA